MSQNSNYVLAGEGAGEVDEFMLENMPEANLSGANVSNSTFTRAVVRKERPSSGDGSWEM